MGEVVSLAAYRLARGQSRLMRRPPEAHDPADHAVAAAEPRGTSAPGGHRGLAHACRDMADGLRQMKAASLLLAEATVELRALVREERDAGG